MTPNPTPAERLAEHLKGDWQDRFGDYCIDNYGGRDPTGRDWYAAAEYAEEESE